MSCRIDVRVYPKCHTRLAVQLAGDRVDLAQLRLGFAVEDVNVLTQGKFDLFPRLSDTREDDLRGVSAGLQDAVKLSAGYDVKAGARFGQESQDLQI